MNEKNEKHLDNLIQKSRPLLNLWRSDFEIYEFKLLDLYLSKINSDNPKKRTVVIEKGKVEEIFGVSRLRKESLFPQLEKLQTTKVSLSKDANEYNNIILFSQATAKKDEDGVWRITLTCSPEAMQYIFNLKEIGYIKYRLKSITQLTRTSSYILFNYIENYVQSRRQTKNHEPITWKVDLIELKQMLRCDTVKSYNEYKEFNRRVLSACHKEITKKTSLNFDYEPYKVGRYTKGIEITVYSNVVLTKSLPLEKEPDEDFDEENEKQEELEKVEDNKAEDFDESFEDILEILSASCANEFTKQEINELFHLISCVPNEYLPVTDIDDITLRRDAYLSQKYSVLQNYAKRVNINNRFAYLKRIIKNDLENMKVQHFSTKEQ